NLVRAQADPTVVNYLKHHRHLGLLDREVDQDDTMQEVEDKGLEAVLVLEFLVQPSANGFEVCHHVLRSDTTAGVDLLDVHSIEQSLLCCSMTNVIHPELLLKPALPSDLAVNPGGQF